jgi:putative nucleotidyltransferase with HDIG domain
MVSPQQVSAALAPVRELPWLVALRRRFPAAECFVVGGMVRDAALGRPLGDLDLVVRGVALDDLLVALADLGSVDVVGRDFGVIAFVPAGERGDRAVDVALPRTERSRGTGGYRDVAVHADPALPVADDLSRRDFTVNAMAWDVATGELHDPFGGLADCEARVLRAVGDAAVRFGEDATRVLRGLRFASSLGCQFEPATWSALVAAVPVVASRVAPEMVAKEVCRAFEADPAIAVDVYDRSGALFALIPEMAPTRGCAQPANYHGEGDVWTHTKMALAALASPGFSAFFAGERPSLRAVLGALFHDIAKPDTAAVRDGKLTFYGHPDVGAEKVLVIAERLRLSSAGVDPARLAWLVKMHLVPNMLRLDEVRPATLHRHFLRDPALGRDLLHLAYADAAATIHEDGAADFATLRAVRGEVERLATEHGTGEPRPLLGGDEIMALLGLSPGPDVRAIKDALWEAQLSGEIATKDGALRFLRNYKKEG